MSILIVDNSLEHVLLIKSILAGAGYTETITAQSGAEALEQLRNVSPGTINSINIVLLSFDISDMNGIEVCRNIRTTEHIKDIPTIMMITESEKELVFKVLEAGALDYVVKPLDEMELVIRVRIALRLKWETERRKAHEMKMCELTKQLEQAEHLLRQYTSQDSVTGLANRRTFEEGLDKEWRRSMREGKAMSVLLIDIDHFRAYNEFYSTQAGDECLKRIAKALKNELKRPGDLVARYNGGQFMVLLSDTDALGATVVGEMLRTKIASLKISHEGSPTGSYLTVSTGVANAVPDRLSIPSSMIASAMSALELAKQEGHNRVKRA
ncbi:MAG: diguanylate cyclase domain-containing protein [Acidobacteriota bacterium]